MTTETNKELSPLDQILVDTISEITAGTKEMVSTAKDISVKAIDFASEQIPDIIHQLLTFKLIESVVFVIIGLLMTYSFIYFYPKVREWGNDNGDDAALPLFSAFGGVGLFIVGIVVTVNNLLVVFKIWFAPKIYLIEYAAQLMK